MFGAFCCQSLGGAKVPDFVLPETLCRMAEEMISFR
jgi:hypothetical protein